MRRTLRKVTALLSVFYADMMQYRAELFLWALSGIMPFFLMGLWAKASITTEMSMDSVGFVRYFLCVYIVRQVTLVWVIYEVEEDVVKGRLSQYLLHPISPFWRYLAGHVSERAARIPFLIVLTAIFFSLYPRSFWVPDAAHALAAILTMGLAFALRFVMQYAFAMLAFWTERANAIEDLWFALYLFLSGFIAPLDVFPEGVREFAMWTPFPYLIYLPAQVMTGADLGQVPRGLAVMLAWGLVFVGLQQLLWRMGLRRYSAMGA
jgi:ABC-2 type transport system permease protein